MLTFWIVGNVALDVPKKKPAEFYKGTPVAAFPRIIKVSKVRKFETSAPCFILSYLLFVFLSLTSGAAFHIFRAYSFIALSQAKQPAFAVFISDILFHSALSS